jgi:hypothetical protein
MKQQFASALTPLLHKAKQWVRSETKYSKPHALEEWCVTLACSRGFVASMGYIAGVRSDHSVMIWMLC